ncbi:hypothetical protein [Azospirillum sp.]|uniref:hypothetical protein n=1 Tax=Azospirillum sp. TaxID=34012 RepID=UPI002D4E9F11|nr:hypothetical protein [Azospirillum sp.]HYF87499.1 hypothetical protein [Azospirillum sp.]
MRNWLKTVLLFSAFSPALLTLAYVRYDADPNDNVAIYLAIVGACGFLSVFFIFRAVNHYGQRMKFVAKKVKPNDHLLIGFLFSYFIPIIARAAQLDAPKTTLLTLILLFALWIVSSVPAHPLLSVLGFRFYEVEADHGFVYTVISRRELTHPADIKAVRKISSSMLLEVE